ncbi:MAG: LysM peptidoglycan-binding domain-containing protein [Saprospirales bacterium]|nr:LysM peptidoglycan-binding domain-containing protein [Saprospirales bacterium]
MVTWLLSPILLFATGDSLHYLTPKDTIFLYLSGGEKIFEHQIERKQTLFSLAKFYGLGLDELYFYNPEISGGQGPALGQSVRIPIPNRAILRYYPPKYSQWDYIPVYYMVQQGETLYRICREYFKMPIDTIIRRNNLIDNQLKVGQPLHIGWMSVHGIPDSLRVHGGIMAGTNSELGRIYQQEFFSKKEFTQQGAAQWPKDDKQNAGGGLYALHNEAPLGSIIAATNPMTKRTIYVRVIGRIPDWYEQKVIVVLSPAVAISLGAIDHNFFVHLRYLK